MRAGFLPVLDNAIGEIPMATLGVFVKQPIPGQVKTRLGREIGNDLAAQLYEAFLNDFVHSLSELSNIEIVLAFSPSTDSAETYFQNFGGEKRSVWQQPQLDLGERMQRFIEDHLRNDNPVVIVGSDSPTLPISSIHSAFELLKKNSVVLGPAVDGGYYLVGQNKLVPEIFSGIEWSATNVLQQTVERLKATGHSLEVLPPWYDIDSLDDLKFLRGHLNALELSKSQEAELHSTLKLLSGIFSQDE